MKELSDQRGGGWRVIFKNDARGQLVVNGEGEEQRIPGI